MNDAADRRHSRNVLAAPALQRILMVTELDQLLDALARRIQRGIGIDDLHLRLIAYSVQQSDVDAVRRNEILTRRASSAVFDWAYGFGIRSARCAVRLPSNADLGIGTRVCIPVRCEDVLLGYMWITDHAPPLSDDHVRLAEATAEAAGAIMYAAERHGQARRALASELVAKLLSPVEGTRTEAAGEVVEHRLFVVGCPIAVLTADFGREREVVIDESARASLMRAVERLEAESPPRRVLAVLRADHACVIVATGDRPSVGRDPIEVAGRLHELVIESLGRDPRRASVRVGVGGTRKTLAEACRSYRESRRSADLGRIDPAFGEVVAWGQLGVYQLLTQLPGNSDPTDGVHPGLMRLFNHRNASLLVSTLECFLDLAGDMKSVAAQLYIHRATLYYRLNNVEEIARISLRNGEDRFAMYLGLKLARLRGIHPIQSCGVRTGSGEGTLARTG